MEERNPLFTKKNITERPPEEAPAILQNGNLGKPVSFYGQNKFFVWVLVFGLIAIAAIGALVFLKPAPQVAKEANVEVFIEAPKESASGGESVFRFKIANKDSQKLTQLSLELVNFAGFNYLASSPRADNLSGSVYTVPDLLPGQNAVVMVKFRTLGDMDEIKKIQAKLHYRLGNFNSEFVKTAESETRITAANAVLEIFGPLIISPAETANYEIRYRNNSEQMIAGARLKFSMPDAFSFSGSEPTAVLSNNIWNLGDLPSGSEGKVVVRGYFKPAMTGESANFSAQLETVNPQGGFFTQASASLTTAIKSQPVSVSQEIQGAEGGVVSPGGRITVNIQYQNNSPSAVSGVNIFFNLDSKVVDLASLSAEGGVVSGSSVSWNASGVPSLENLPPSDSGRVSVSFKIKNPATLDSSQNLWVVSGVKIKVNEYSDAFLGNDAKIKVASPVTLKSLVEYKEGNQPPKVGQITTYKITFSINNSTNLHKNGILTAFLPLGSGSFVPSSIPSSESGKVQFDNSLSRLTWQAGDIPAHAGKFAIARTLSFLVKLTPSLSQVNQSPVLVNNIKFQSTDSFTERTEIISLKDISIANVSGSDYQWTTVQE